MTPLPDKVTTASKTRILQGTFMMLSDLPSS